MLVPDHFGEIGSDYPIQLNLIPNPIIDPGVNAIDLRDQKAMQKSKGLGLLEHICRNIRAL